MIFIKMEANFDFMYEYNIMDRFIKELAPLMEKSEDEFNWMFSARLPGCRGNGGGPFLLLRIEAIDTFKDPEKVKMLTPKIFEFWQKEYYDAEDELNLEKEHIVVLFHNLEATHVAMSGKTVAELRE